MNGHIMLIGFMGTGKSTISHELAKKTGRKEIDLDAFIEEKKQKEIKAIFAEEGEEKFREYESECLIEVLQDAPEIISCGGGTVIREENVRHMKEKGRIVLLIATPQTVYERVKDSDNRPVLNGNMNPEYIEKLMEKRRALYDRASDITVSTDGKSPQQIAEEILQKTEEEIG